MGLILRKVYVKHVLSSAIAPACWQWKNSIFFIRTWIKTCFISDKFFKLFECCILFVVLFCKKIKMSRFYPDLALKFLSISLFLCIHVKRFKYDRRSKSLWTVTKAYDDFNKVKKILWELSKIFKQLLSCFPLANYPIKLWKVNQLTSGTHFW